MTTHGRGLLLAVVGVVILSPDSLLLRLVGVDVWTTLFWRGLGLFVVLASLSLWRHGRQLPRHLMGFGGFGVGIVLGFSSCQVAFVGAIELTGVANVLVLVSATPLVAALVSGMGFGERLSRGTWLAIAWGTLGALIAASEALGGLHWRGDLLALVVPIALGISFSLIRAVDAPDAWILFALSGLLTAVVTAPFAGDPVTGLDGLWLVLLALVVAPLPFVFINIALRRIPAAEVSLVMLMETLLGPLWVWLALGEVPTLRALLGGGILLTTVVLHATSRREPTPSGPP
ncbi:MAG: DMT family transporter [Candidatus Competibacterales bacterium]